MVQLTLIMADGSSQVATVDEETAANIMCMGDITRMYDPGSDEDDRLLGLEYADGGKLFARTHPLTLANIPYQQ